MADALERLRQRTTRPTVPSRDASLMPTAVEMQTPISADISISRQPEFPNTTNPDVQPAAVQLSASIEPTPVLQTKQTTLRFEQGMSDRLQELCRKQGICREVLIEAMFEQCETNPELLAAVLAEAKIKNEQRQQVANQKRAKSMMERFGS